MRLTAESERSAVMSPVAPLDILSSSNPRKRPRPTDEKVQSRYCKVRKGAKVANATDEETIIVEIK